ncbi:MAG: helix-turn-helix domain-containing protein [Rhizobiaceae bacterium]|nr:helix-turn-helix domain-containing protein [Rhizobiaceae bacterium]
MNSSRCYSIPIAISGPLAPKFVRSKRRTAGSESQLVKPLSEKDASILLGVSIDTIQRIRKRGEIAFRKIGGRIRYTQADLAEYLEASRVTPCVQSRPVAAATPTTFQNGHAPHTTMPRGSTPQRDKRAAFRSAQITFGKPKSV